MDGWYVHVRSEDLWAHAVTNIQFSLTDTTEATEQRARAFAALRGHVVEFERRDTRRVELEINIAPQLGLTRKREDVHALYGVPVSMPLDSVLNTYLSQGDVFKGASLYHFIQSRLYLDRAAQGRARLAQE